VLVDLEDVVFGCDDEDGSLLVLVLVPVCAQRMRMRAHGRAARGGRVRIRSPRGTDCILGWSRIQSRGFRCGVWQHGTALSLNFFETELETRASKRYG
jgi:hypothetical protein